MKAGSEQIGPNREQLKQPSSVFDILQDEIRYAQIYNKDLKAESRMFQENITGIQRIYTIDKGGDRPYIPHMLLDSINDDLEAMVVVGEGINVSDMREMSDSAFKGALMSVHAHTSLMPGGTGRRMELLKTSAYLVPADYDESEDINKAVFESTMRAEMHFIDQEYASLSRNKKRVLDMAALLACPTTPENRTFFKRGFLFANNRVKAVLEGELGEDYI